MLWLSGRASMPDVMPVTASERTLSRKCTMRDTRMASSELSLIFGWLCSPTTKRNGRKLALWRLGILSGHSAVRAGLDCFEQPFWQPTHGTLFLLVSVAP